MDEFTLNISYNREFSNNDTELKSELKMNTGETNHDQMNNLEDLIISLSIDVVTMRGYDYDHDEIIKEIMNHIKTSFEDTIKKENLAKQSKGVLH